MPYSTWFKSRRLTYKHNTAFPRNPLFSWVAPGRETFDIRERGGAMDSDEMVTVPDKPQNEPPLNSEKPNMSQLRD